MIGQFPRKPMAIRQVLAQVQPGAGCAFAPKCHLPHHGARARGQVPDARFCLDCYPFRLRQRPPLLPVFGVQPISTALGGRIAAHARTIPFRSVRFPLFCAAIVTFERGSVPCSNPFLLSVFSASPVCPPARLRAHRSMPTVPRLERLAARRWARRPTTTLHNRPSLAACWAPLLAIPALANKRVTPAGSGGASGDIQAIGAIAPVAFYIFRARSVA